MAARVNLSLRNGVAIIASDAHYWPGKPSTAHRAVVAFARKLKPDVFVLNGDGIDASTISRHPPIGWERHPTVWQEVNAAKERLGEIEVVTKDAERIWTLGNHDARFETKLATVAPEFRGVHGVHLRDHFPAWAPAWSVAINGRDGVVIKHRFKGGTNAAYNNAVSSGRSVVTGHLHSLKVAPFSDYNGTRFGVDGGMLADPAGEQFLGYSEDNPHDWRSGFVVLTFKGGRLLWPEVVHVIGKSEVEWRGSIIKV